MIRINIDKLYRFEHKTEPLCIGFPLPKGTLTTTDRVNLYAGETRLPIQPKVTARYEDGSIKFLFLRFLADVPAYKGMTVDCDLAGEAKGEIAPFSAVKISNTDNGLRIETGADNGLCVELKNGSDSIFEQVTAGGRTYGKDVFEGPVLNEKGQKGAYGLTTENWEIIENGPVCAIAAVKGTHTAADTDKKIRFEVRITAWAGKPWVETSYRIINSDDAPLNINTLRYELHLDNPEGARTCVANSNYETSYAVSENGEKIVKTIDADWIMKEANEHFCEVFHGTFFADVTGAKDGVTATIFQAHQNFPKALEADNGGIRIMLVPENAGEVIMQSGMAREQKFLLHFHDAEETLESLNDRSIVYQMPNRPHVSPEVMKESGVWPRIFADKTDFKVEQALISRGDGHCRAYGMLNFGDGYDSNYTAQGRGNGKLVWLNNEYDYPHACALLFARTGVTRFLDYLIVSATHWMDVDVCHYHKDPMFLGGQWEHTAGHVINGRQLCSHQWVEGLLDYYHFTGDERGLETAIGIGHNVQRLLDTPAFAKIGEANARETGWALRTLTALYLETHDESWLAKCERIVNDFRVWEETYGHWMAPYTDNTLIRVPFMIAVAVGSLMRYYNVFPNEELKAMILRQVDDLIENCYVKEWGLFYYKELPTLNRLGNNTLLLEALTYAYDLSGDPKYLTYGIETFKNAMEDRQGYSSTKRKIEDTVLVGKASAKIFAQSMFPLSIYYRALAESDTDYR